VWPQSLVRYSRTSSRTAAECRHLSGNVLGIKEESRAGIIQALWSYIKTHNLQDKVDRKRIHADAMLRPVRVHVLLIGTLMPIPSVDIWRRSDPVQFLAGDGQSLSCAIKSGGHPLRVNPSTPPPERPTAWDIELKLEDVTLKSKMQAVTLNASRDTLRELTKLDDEVRSWCCTFCLVNSQLCARRSRRSRNRFNHLS
jgi:SWI/SNF-related matrix-associated actin-dependent regulator of chromatin subfamily D